jgi:hypothetical protein
MCHCPQRVWCGCHGSWRRLSGGARTLWFSTRSLHSASLNALAETAMASRFLAIGAAALVTLPVTYNVAVFPGMSLQPHR